jgi:hypothetical protein
MIATSALTPASTPSPNSPVAGSLRVSWIHVCVTVVCPPLARIPAFSDLPHDQAVDRDAL